MLGGGQFYQDLTTNGESALANSPSLDLKYYYQFPVGFDFGGRPRQDARPVGRWRARLRKRRATLRTGLVDPLHVEGRQFVGTQR